MVVTGTTYDCVKLFADTLISWPLVALVVLIFLYKRPDFLQRISKITVGNLVLELNQIKQELAESRSEIRSLENELELSRQNYADILNGIDGQAPVPKLKAARDAIKSAARGISDFKTIEAFLGEKATAEEIFFAAVALRDRRPLQMFDPLVSCLERLGSDPGLAGVRLNTVWTLTSALHFMVISSVRDNAKPQISREGLLRAKKALERLSRNPLVLGDRQDEPDKGIRGPLRHALQWIEQGLEELP
ncbi:MAG: hypothetical protein DI528_00250 [Shinella sp.]|nr:MAG: hypothetical protein DI528_00250 [Shinella sp.]